MDTLLEKYPDLKGFYWAKDKGALPTRNAGRGSQAVKSADDAELIR